MATLLHLAKEHGFTLPKTGQAPAAPSAAELAERERQRAERQRQEQADRLAAQEGAAAEALNTWDGPGRDVTDPSQAPYLVRKGVGAHGVRYMPPGTLLVPLRDASGKLWNLQRIAPAKPERGAPEKLFLKGGRKSGLWHLVGELASGGDGGTDTTGPAVLLIGEGYATCATLHEATGYPVAVAFDAGNLQHVARALRQQHPAALLVLCGDDDQATEAKDGSNPGRQKATAAAQAVRGVAVFPEGLPPGGSDFNDLAAHVNAQHGDGAGIEAVRHIVAAAIDAHTAKAWLMSNGSIPFERCLRLPPTPEAFRRMQRDVWLCQAARQMQAATDWETCSQLLSEWDRFLSRGPWREWRDDPEPPPWASSLQRALFFASRFNRGNSLGERQLHRITRHVFRGKSQ